MPATDKMLGAREGAIGWITFNNPARRNAVSLAMWQALGEMVRSYVEDPSVRAIVLRGAGDEAFVSGADISEFEEKRSSEETTAAYNRAAEEATAALEHAGKPTIAMIRGYCIGGGLGLAICADMRICSDNSKFGIPAVKLGLGYGYVGVKRLVDLTGPSYAKEIFFTARQFDADEARMMGLVNRVVPSAELESYVKKYADTISENAPLTINAVKVTIHEAVKDESKRNIALSDALVKKCFDSNDYKEGRKAFMEKRKPVFTGT
jgi:enoyl-CoA hydratase/carnithine racemase